MNGKRIWLGGLAVTLLGLGAARGQGLPTPYNDPGARMLPPPGAVVAPPPPPNFPGVPPLPGPAVPPGPPVPAQPQLSDYIVGKRGACCCGPIGFDGPIGYEVFVRPGISFPIGGRALTSRLNPGWSIEGGARTLFFDPDHMAAWTASLSISNHFNTADLGEPPVILRDVLVRLPRTSQLSSETTTVVPELSATVRSVNRTFVNAALGREWYLTGDEGCHDGPGLRVGADVGGGWGTGKLNIVEVTHRTDVIGRFFIAAHSDVEVPWGGGALFGGVRLEWSYTWSDMLQRENNGDINELNLQFTFGVRF